MRRQSGFTLLELLIALSVFAILSVMAYRGLAAVAEAKNRVEARSERLAALQLALGILERDLEQAIGRSVRDEYGEARPALEGSTLGPELLRLTRAGWRNPSGAPRSTLQRVAYQFRDRTLIRRHWRVLDRAQDSPPLERALLQRVHNVEVRFLDHRLQWQGAWPPDPRADLGLLPRAVEITVELDDLGAIRRLFRLPPGEAAQRGAGAAP